jgi:hypothetical protein
MRYLLALILAVPFVGCVSAETMRNLQADLTLLSQTSIAQEADLDGRLEDYAAEIGAAADQAEAAAEMAKQAAATGMTIGETGGIAGIAMLALQFYRQSTRRKEMELMAAKAAAS